MRPQAGRCDRARMLPHRPLLRTGAPITWRTDSQLLLGSPPDTVCLEGVSAAWLAWMHALDGSRTLPEVVSSAPQPQTADVVLRALTLAHCLDDAALAPRTLRTASRRLRDLLCATRPAAVGLHGLAPHALAALDRRATARVSVLGAPQLVHAAAAQLTAGGIGVCTDGSWERSAAVVWCTTSDPDAWEDSPWRHRRLHLTMAVHGRRISIGPLVAPGRTACHGCARLHRIDTEPQWPRIATQLVHRGHAPVDAVAAGVAAALTAMHVAGLVEQGAPDRSRALPPSTLWGQRLEVELPSGTVRGRVISTHPACACQWDAAPASQ